MKYAIAAVALTVIPASVWFFNTDQMRTMMPADNTTDIEVIATTTSKYDNINVKTIERRENEGRSLMSVAFPVTENDSINTILEVQANEFIAEFERVATEQEELYQDYLAETGTVANSAVANFIQHFDVSFANKKYLSIVFDRYISTGGTGNESTFAIIFNRQTGEGIPLAEVFSSEKYLTELSNIAREKLYQRTETLAQALDGTELAIKEYIERSKETINNGTEPTPENFDGMFISDDGTLTITFDKYQVGAGSEGLVSIEIHLEEIADLLAPEVRDIFSIAPPTPVPVKVPASVQPQVTSGVDCDIAKCVALTFDDGPSVYTATLLDTLDKYNVPATFFVLGRSSQIQPDTITRIVADGHELGNHTWDHKDLRTLSDADIDAQLQRTDDLIESIVGVRPQYLRPPYGAINNVVRSYVDVPIVLWTVDPEDWKRPPHDELIRRMTQPVKSGYIILAHDIHQPTVAAVPEVIAALQAEGYTFVTVSDILRQPLVPGQAYRQR